LALVLSAGQAASARAALQQTTAAIGALTALGASRGAARGLAGTAHMRERVARLPLRAGATIEAAAAAVGNAAAEAGGAARGLAGTTLPGATATDFVRTTGAAADADPTSVEHQATFQATALAHRAGLFTTAAIRAAHAPTWTGATKQNAAAAVALGAALELGLCTGPRRAGGRPRRAAVAEVETAAAASRCRAADVNAGVTSGEDQTPAAVGTTFRVLAAASAE
jgi:hypothetical protein